MSKPKGKTESRDLPIEDPQVLQDALQGLFDGEIEFPIKVEGTSTLPYSSRIQSLHAPEGYFILKLVRPLPHELLGGAIFRMLFAVEDQRLEGLIQYASREAYLQYRFQLPTELFHADRRRHKRFPFRPRENAYVIAQDGGIPGLGVAGPLVNIGMGGFALRVDRVLKLDDGMRVPVNTALFDRGKGFAQVRVQELPKLHLLEARGITTHTLQRGTEVILGMNFVGLMGEEESALAQALDLRDRMGKGGQTPRGEGAPAKTLGGPRGGAPESEDLEEETAAATGLTPSLEPSLLLRLQRRTARVLVVMADGPQRQGLLALLREHGYHRLEALDELAQVKSRCAADPQAPLPRLLLADLALADTGDAEPLAAVRIIEHQVAEAGPLPTVILCETVDPTLFLDQASATRFLPYDFTDAAPWIGTLDALLEQR